MKFNSREKVVYFHLGGLGDSVHDLSVLSQLLVEFPNGQIYYICNKGGEDILRYSYLWEKVKVITINSKINVISAIFQAPFRPDLFIAGCGSNIAKVNVFKNFLLPRTSGASIPDYPNQKLINFWTKVSTFDVLLQPIVGVHRVFTNWKLISSMGVRGNIHPPKLDYSKIVDVKLPTNFSKIIFKDYLVVHHGSASLDSPKHFKESEISKIIDKIIDKYELDVLLVGGVQEEQASRRIINKCNNISRIFNATGGLSLPQLMQIIKNSKIVIGTDSGPGHIAAALGVPTVSIFGPTSPSQCSPFMDGSYVVSHPVDCSPCYLSDKYERCSDNVCMKSINSDSIVQAVSLTFKDFNNQIHDHQYGDCVEKVTFDKLLK